MILIKNLNKKIIILLLFVSSIFACSKENDSIIFSHPIGEDKILSIYKNKTNNELFDKSGLLDGLLIKENNNLTDTIKFDSLLYSKRYIEIIKMLENNLGVWNGFYYLYDYNANGYPEIFLFKLTGMSFTIKIYEIRDNKFIDISKSKYFNLISIFTLEAIPEIKGFKINANSDTTIIYWNEKQQQYLFSYFDKNSNKQKDM